MKQRTFFSHAPHFMRDQIRKILSKAWKDRAGHNHLDRIRPASPAQVRASARKLDIPGEVSEIPYSHFKPREDAPIWLNRDQIGAGSSSKSECNSQIRLAHSDPITLQVANTNKTTHN